MATCKNTSPAAEGDMPHPALADRLGLALKSAYQLDTLISRLDAELDDRDEVNVGLGEIAVAKLLIGRCHALTDALIGLCDHNAESDPDRAWAEFEDCSATVTGIFGKDAASDRGEPAASATA